MTVSSGRANSGARSVLRAVFCGVFAIVGLVAGGCGNSNFTYGTTIVTVSADPGPFTAYVADITAISLLRSDGTYGYTFSPPAGGKTVDFTRLADETEIFGAPAVLEGTYTQATITINYGAGANSIASQIYVDVGGQSQAATIVDSTGATPTTISYTVKFDPTNPLVVKGGVPSKLDLHFDLAASTVIDATVSPVKATVRPFLTASTQPAITKVLRNRGEFVTANVGGSNFTVNAVSFNDSPSYINSPQGAIQVQTDGNTIYNVNGQVFTGSAGLTAISTLPLNTIITSYGAFGDLSQQKPQFIATTVYAGTAAESILATRVQGTVVSRTGNTLHIHNADLITTTSVLGATMSLPTGVFVKFFNDVTVTVNDATVVTVDGQPNVASSSQLISVGQHVDAVGALGALGANTATVDVSGGLVRLNTTPAWGTLQTAGPDSSGNNTATVTLLELGSALPSALTFTGTGSATTGADADPTAYQIGTGTVDLSTNATATPLPLVRFDGMVTPFGSAPPDFSAETVTLGDSTEQLLMIDWVSPGTTAPFLSQSSSGLVVNIDNASLGTAHAVLQGPTSVDLKALEVSPTIVAAVSPTGQFAIGNPASTTGINMFNSFPAYLTQLNSVINGTNTILKLVAVGQLSSDNKTFTAYRIDIVQLP